MPRRLEEGQEIALAKPELELALGQPVAFPLYSSTVRGGDKAGDLLTLPPEQLLHLPPLHTILRGGKRAGTRNVPVTLAARCTETGTLELYCVAKDGNNRWRLEFNVRDIVRDPDGEAGGDGDGETPRGSSVTDVWPERRCKRRQLIRLQRSGRARCPRIDQGTRAADGRDMNADGLCRACGTSSAKWPSNGATPGAPEPLVSIVATACVPFHDSLDRFRGAVVEDPALHAEPGAGAPRIPEGGADY